MSKSTHGHPMPTEEGVDGLPHLCFLTQTPAIISQRWFIFRSITYRHRNLAVRNSVSVSHKLPNSQRLPAVWLTPVWELDVTKAPCRFGRDIFGAQEMWRLVISECKFSASLEKLLNCAGHREE